MLRRLRLFLLLAVLAGLPVTASADPVDAPARRSAVDREVDFVAWRANDSGSRDAGARIWDCAMCPELIVVPAGAFTIGSPAFEPGRGSDEGPQRRIVVGRAFAVGRFEVTRGEYEAFLAATGYPIAGNCITDRVNRGTWVPDPGTTLRDPGYPQTGTHPVACVSWNDARAYVAWLNRLTSGGYRLLTEAEWEYLARAGSTTAYPWGADVNLGCEHMNGSDATLRAVYPSPAVLPAGQTATCSDGALNTAPVGAYLPNAFGLHDMLGNVSEWVEDCATENYETMPEDGGAARGDCARRMVRGGSWGTYARQLRSAERLRYAPDDRDDSIGIRVARTLP